ncbi:MAG: O-antigen ligase family protein, partial [Erysipelotrichaceae bacterium]|nr:O-antigen ligase family protein [Erysipelotrichaceae bacterium]
LFYRVYITNELFDFITDLLVVLSVFAAFYGLIEYIGILNNYEINQFEVIIFNSPQDRVNSVFFNANYYAMMIEFFVCLIFYKILKLKDPWHHLNYLIYYIFATILNLFLLVLTACRTAWPALAVGIIVMLILDRHYKTCSAIFAGVIALCGYFVFNPEKFPRFDNIIAYFKTREKIWSTAIANIKTHPLFGEGPMTYMHIYEQYNGHPTQHAHSVYLDPLLCFGVVGLATIAPYVISMLKGIYRLFSRKQDLELFALIIAYIVIVLIHGTMDYTIFFVQTVFLFLLICSSYEIYANE